MIFRSSLSKQILALTGIMLLAGGIAFAQAPEPGDQASGSKAPQTIPTSPDGVDTQGMNDKIFVRDALEGGMAEVQFGQLAAQKGSSDDVKKFGQQMVTDHTELGNTLSQVAQKLNTGAPKGLSKKDKQELAKLQALSGAQFDDAYIELMIKNHKKDATTFKTEGQMTGNPDVRQAAEKGEAMILTHLQVIQQIAQVHNVQAGK